MRVPFSYLDRQFADVDAYLADLKALVLSGDFTLGQAVSQFEAAFAEVTGIPYAVGVGSGTDALILSLKALGVGPGDAYLVSGRLDLVSRSSQIGPVGDGLGEGNRQIGQLRLRAGIEPHRLRGGRQ